EAPRAKRRPFAKVGVARGPAPPCTSSCRVASLWDQSVRPVAASRQTTASHSPRCSCVNVLGTMLLGGAAYAAQKFWESWNGGPPEGQYSLPDSPSLGDMEGGLRMRGEFGLDAVLVVGSSGAGKSSLINLVKGEPVCPVNAVASTTRWLQGVRVIL